MKLIFLFLFLAAGSLSATVVSEVGIGKFFYLRAADSKAAVDELVTIVKIVTDKDTGVKTYYYHAFGKDHLIACEVAELDTMLKVTK